MQRNQASPIGRASSVVAVAMLAANAWIVAHGRCVALIMIDSP
jgi:hypothetical protein